MGFFETWDFICTVKLSNEKWFFSKKTFSFVNNKLTAAVTKLNGSDEEIRKKVEKFWNTC